MQIWNHPDVLHKIVKKELNITDDLDIDEALKSEAGAKKGRGKGPAAAAGRRMGASPGPGASPVTSQAQAVTSRRGLIITTS